MLGKLLKYELKATSQIFLPFYAAILILGGGCANCQALERAVRAAMAELNIQEEVGHVTDFAQIAAYGVLTTPALVVDGQVLSAGQVLSVEQAKALLAKARG